jgi:hypothetical protein
MSNEIQKTEKRLADAQAAQAAMIAELDKTTGELERLDMATGDIDKVVDAKIRLETKTRILEKRIQFAAEAVNTLQGDLLIEREHAAEEQAKTATARLEAVKDTARAEIMKLIRGGGLQPQEMGAINTVVLLHRNVAPLIAEAERLALRHREAEARAADTNRRRLMAESQAINAAQNDVFEGKI